MNETLKGKRLLITGGTGSFGKEMVRKLTGAGCSEIIVFSRDEFKQDLMRAEFSKVDNLSYVIGDIRDVDSIKTAMRGVDFVFHASALKQVPSCEFYPLEAVKTNILGSSNVINAAIENKVKRLVCLSTDKAVYPVNAMGMSKAMMEKLAQAQARSSIDTKISCVRYGNVMYSRGSVIPLFVKQIRDGQPLTITNPDMTRFLMNLDEAIDLVIESFEHAVSGDIFVRKAPAATIGVLASAIGKFLNVEPEIKIIGERHGEKLFEVLASSQELQRSEERGEYIRVAADTRDLDYEKYNGGFSTTTVEDYTSHNTTQLDIDEVVTLLGKLDNAMGITQNIDMKQAR